MLHDRLYREMTKNLFPAFLTDNQETAKRL
jgi:hypothetical protein